MPGNRPCRKEDRVGKPWRQHQHLVSNADNVHLRSSDHYFIKERQHAALPHELLKWDLRVRLYLTNEKHSDPASTQYSNPHADVRSGISVVYEIQVVRINGHLFQTPSSSCFTWVRATACLAHKANTAPTSTSLTVCTMVHALCISGVSVRSFDLLSSAYSGPNRSNPGKEIWLLREIMCSPFSFHKIFRPLRLSASYCDR